MRNPVPNLWTLGDLSLPELIRRTVRASWRDDVFGQGGRMAFYQFLAIFPCLLVGLTIVTHLPHLSHHVQASFSDVSTQLFPSRVSQLFQGMVADFGERPRFGLRLVSVCAAGIWAAHNGTWAIIHGLNRAYEVKEDRPRWDLTVRIVALTLCLAAAALFALLFVFCSAYLQTRLHGGVLLLRVLDWLALIVCLGGYFVLLYRFGPNLTGHALRWCTPGALCALVLWLASTFVANIYFDRVNDYTRSYGPLNGVVMLLLWLYASNGSLLMGGEMNSEILKAETGRPNPSAQE